MYRRGAHPRQGKSTHAAEMVLVRTSTATHKKTNNDSSRPGVLLFSSLRRLPQPAASQTMTERGTAVRHASTTRHTLQQ